MRGEPGDDRNSDISKQNLCGRGESGRRSGRLRVRDVCVPGVFLKRVEWWDSW